MNIPCYYRETHCVAVCNTYSIPLKNLQCGNQRQLLSSEHSKEIIVLILYGIVVYKISVRVKEKEIIS